MLILKTPVCCVLLACLAQQLCLSTGVRVTVRREETVDPGVIETVRTGGSGRPAGRARSTEPKGKFTTKSDTQCTWQSYRDPDKVRIQISCENSQEARARDGVVVMKACEYVGKPHRCPGYSINPKGFWRQVGRALKKMHEQLCEDTNALVRAGLCRGAHRDSNFRFGPLPPRRVRPETTTARSASSISISTSTGAKRFNHTVVGTAADGQPCVERAHKQKVREEYCEGTWYSLCAFFFSMLDPEDC